MRTIQPAEKIEESRRYRWTAKNNHTFLNGFRYAKTLRGAIRAARRYLDDELLGEGKIIIGEAGPGYYPFETTYQDIREDEKSIYTNFRWKTTWEA